MTFQLFPTTSTNFNTNLIILSNQSYTFVNQNNLNNPNDYDQNFEQEIESKFEQKEVESTLNSIAPSTMRIFLWMICLIGIFLNICVFRKQKYTKYFFQTLILKIVLRKKHSAMQLLCIMAISDTISLGSLILTLLTPYLGIKSHTIFDIICKVCFYFN